MDTTAFPLFSFCIGFIAGYGARAMISLRRRREEHRKFQERLERRKADKLRSPAHLQKQTFERIFLAILFCTIAERAIAQVNFELPPLEGAIKGSFAGPQLKDWAGQCAGVSALSVQPAPSITSKKPVPPASVPESAASSLSALQNGAEDGDPIAQWKLGRMYAEGNDVAQNDLLAFDYFSRIANAHGKVSPSAPEAQIVANALVALGRYYLTGIPNSKITSDPERAREMFSYAASYFGNADAQYDLARLYLKNAGTSRDDFRYGARWLGLAAQKGQHQAQALLGQMLFDGDCLPPQRARGLMWLTLAYENADPEESWIKESYNRAMASASESDRATALQMLRRWLEPRR
jgi:exopolysaccharide production negative regulator